MSLSGKVAIVTGGSKGIGRAISHRLAQDGASVLVNFSSDTAAADEVVSAIGPDRALAVQADVGSVAGVEKFVAAVVEMFGRVDVDHGQPTEDFDRAFALNVNGPYFLVQKAAEHKAPGGRIIFVSTGNAKASTVTPPHLLYGATKGAVEQRTRIMAKDLAAKGISVNVVAPGPTGTELFFEGKSQAMLEGIKKASPFGRLGEPEDIANVVALLSGKDSQWVAGQIIHANGVAFF